MSAPALSTPITTDSAASAVLQKKESIGPGDYVGRWRIERTIGQGTYGKVRLGIDPATGEKVAIKIIEKAQVQSQKQIARLQREIRFLRLLNHPHIVKVYDVNETDAYIYIIMEYASGGELFDYIVAHKRVKEREARSFFRQVLSAVDYCHKNAVIHRDLKPENLLLDESKTIKIIDFGFGNNFTMDGLLDTFCGSPFYAAPEMILGKKYEGPEVDMWSLGVILFALLCGHLPFDDDNMKELYRKIAAGSYTCPDYLMPSARHLIGRLITVDPKKRATLDEVMAHPWVNEGYDCPPPNYLFERPTITDAHQLDKDVVQRLMIFGYTMEDVEKAFGPKADHHKPSPVRATYFLLKEMLHRDERKDKVQKRRSSHSGGLLGKNVSISTPNVAATEANGQESDLGTIGENDKADAQKDKLRYGAAAVLREFASEQSLSKDRRASTPDSVIRAQSRESGQTLLESLRLERAKLEARLLVQPPPSAKTRDSGVQQKVGVPVSNDFPSQSSSSTSPPPQRKPPSIPLPPPPSSNDARPHSPRAENADIADEFSKDTWFRRFSVPASVAAPSIVQNREAQSATTSTPPQSTSSSRRGSASGRIREELRAVSGWLFNVSTTSTKPLHDILAEVTKVLTENNVSFQFDTPDSQSSNNDTPVTLTCEADAPIVCNEGTSQSNKSLPLRSANSVAPASTVHPSSSQPSSLATLGEVDAPAAGTKGKQFVSFQITIYKIPRMNMWGLHFKRLHGGVWTYKKVCNKLLGQMNL